MTPTEYVYKIPLFYTGQRVSFMSHHHGIQDGVIMRVETHYGREDNIAYHLYSIQIQGWKRQLHVGETNIRYVK